MNLMNKPPANPKPQKAEPNPEYLAAIHDLPCWICFEYDMIQETRTTAHHFFHDRYGQRKTPDEMAIPLCHCHHLGGTGSDKIAIHQQPDKWRQLYGPDHSYTARTQDLLEEYLRK